MCIRDRAKTLAKHAKTQEASDRLVINKNNEKKNQNLDSTNDAKTVFKLKPVSYTHLDVYKRQAIHYISCKSSA